MVKLHLFADETGQDTQGLFFLVALVVVASDELETIRDRVCTLESASGKTHRWAKSTPKRREAYLAGLPDLLKDLPDIRWRSFGPGNTYIAWLGRAVAETACGLRPYDALTVILDGANWEEEEEVKRALRAAGVRWKKCVGKRDEAEPVLRLADSLAGFLRDKIEDEPMARKAWPALARFFLEL